MIRGRRMTPHSFSRQVRAAHALYRALADRVPLKDTHGSICDSRPTAISGIPQGPMVLTVSQRNHRELETLLRPAARQLGLRAALCLVHRDELRVVLLASERERNFLSVEFLLALPTDQRSGPNLRANDKRTISGR